MGGVWGGVDVLPALSFFLALSKDCANAPPPPPSLSSSDSWVAGDGATLTEDAALTEGKEGGAGGGCSTGGGRGGGGGPEVELSAWNCKRRQSASSGNCTHLQQTRGSTLAP